MDQIETKYARNPDFIYRNIADEAVLLPVHQNVFDMEGIYTLNSVGAFIWEHLDNAMTDAQLLAVLQAEYDASTETLQADLVQFLDEMISIGAIRKV